jgi:hypothetical protein
MLHLQHTQKQAVLKTHFADKLENPYIYHRILVRLNPRTSEHSECAISIWKQLS